MTTGLTLAFLPFPPARASCPVQLSAAETNGNPRHDVLGPFSPEGWRAGSPSPWPLERPCRVFRLLHLALTGQAVLMTKWRSEGGAVLPSKIFTWNGLHIISRVN